MQDDQGKCHIFEIFTRNRLPLSRFLARFIDSPEDVEDLLQDTFLRVYSAGKSVNIASPRAFLFKTARNLAINKLEMHRGRRTTAVANLDEQPARDSTTGVSGPEHEVILEQQLDFALDCLQRLPARSREVFILRKVHGMRQKEIARRLGISESTVEKHIAKGVAKMLDMSNELDVPRGRDR